MQESESDILEDEGVQHGPPSPEPETEDIELISLTFIKRIKKDASGTVTAVTREHHFDFSPHFDGRRVPWKDFVQYMYSEVEDHLEDAKFKPTCNVEELESDTE